MAALSRGLALGAVGLILAVCASVGLVAVFVADFDATSRSTPAADDPQVIAGSRVADTCTVCHALFPDDQPRVGPPLWNIVGADKARFEGYAYSPALAAATGLWTEAELHAFLRDPHGFLPGTRMVFDGIDADQPRADLILFLSTLQD